MKTIKLHPKLDEDSSYVAYIALMPNGSKFTSAIGPCSSEQELKRLFYTTARDENKADIYKLVLPHPEGVEGQKPIITKGDDARKKELAGATS